ncbi:MAG: DUF1553 domain-containing protein [Bacteroidota bacterium]|nr:DUF1553 domain-containing protein [Bacteroidota bacterium]
MPRSVFLFLLPLCYCLCSCGPNLPRDVQQAYDELPRDIDYNRMVKPILSDKCFTCHGPDRAKIKAGLRLDMAESAYGELPESPGKVAIDPGSPDGSELYYRILSKDPQYKMPLPESHLQLSAREKAILIKWIEKGAVYKPHWAFVKPVKSPVPEVGNAHWTTHNPIDNFVLQRLAQEKLQPSPEASRELLLRRVSLDLTGLPPRLQEIDAFLKDKSPNAYEKQVDRLLSSPHYGEKMATDWLDLARYADSHGYTVDRLRDMSPYRDWVINSFNKDMHYDQFVQWQLAGDLMPNPTRDMIIATAFNRNHPQNMEGGIIEQEFQTEYVVDRTNTFGEAFLGLSIGCARCHDHKYDPITQKNYYQVFSFFNNVREAGQISWNEEDMPTPTLMLPTAEKQKIVQFMQANVGSEEKKLAQASADADPSFERWIDAGDYKKLSREKIPADGLRALYNFDKSTLADALNPRQTGSMNRESGAGDPPVYVARDKGKSLLLNGDSWLDLDTSGVFRRSEPFSIGLWVNIPRDLKEGVIFHKGISERLYNYRGYHLYLKDNQLELNMSHTAPSDAITKMTTENIPRDQWIQLTMTYDGSSKAKGLKLFLDGKEMRMETVIDQLTKDIIFPDKKQPGLQIGGWSRGLGFRNGKADDITVYDRELTPYEIQILAGKASWASIALEKKNDLSAAARSALKDYYLSAVYAPVLKEREVLKQLRTALADSVEHIPELMVMQEMPVPKITHVLKRGNYDAPGVQVFPNTPEAIFPFPSKLPKNRYGLAQWVTDPDNPLTARVEVNRLWQNFFGVGLVKTTEDFGNQGEMPSHPELLDWLAVSFRESGWDIKKLNKLIVMSATYRQDSRVTKEVREKDPENRLLSHGPAYRMSAEMIRDNALMASGLLNPKIGGKSIKPYQPPGLWEINSADYVRDSGDAVYRRSIYVIVKRSVPNPTLSSFDAPTRSYCVVRRQSTNTPLQALVTLNDPTFVEACKVLGEQMTKAGDTRDAMKGVYQKLTAQVPSDKILDLLTGLQKTEEDKFREHPEKAAGWLHAGQYKIDHTLDSTRVAADAVVANTILNSDATLTKR